MAGPSGAGSVAHYLKTTRTPRTSAHREIRAAVRRESARVGGGLSELAPFECFSLCLDCGHLSEPTGGDPMRTEARGDQPRRRCPACGELGLADLRHTPTVYSLSELEEDDAEASPGRRAVRLLGLFGLLSVLAGVAALIIDQAPVLADGFAAVGFAMTPILLTCVPLLLALGTSPRRAKRRMPRRWRLPKLGRLGRLGRIARRKLRRGTARETGELLRAPLSGRPCLAYEIGVRDDASPDTSMSSWRLLEQDNAEFVVDDVEVARGQALLRLPRELHSAGVLVSRDENTRRFMRMRGLLETEDVHVYETILVPGEPCAVGRGETSVVQVLAA